MMLMRVEDSMFDHVEVRSEVTGRSRRPWVNACSGVLILIGLTCELLTMCNVFYRLAMYMQVVTDSAWLIPYDIAYRPDL